MREVLKASKHFINSLEVTGFSSSVMVRRVLGCEAVAGGKESVTLDVGLVPAVAQYAGGKVG